MKLRLLPLCLCVFVVQLCSGCFSHNFPRDAYIKGAHSKIVTPWGTSELVIDEAATGTAAKNASLPDGVAPSTSRRISDLSPVSAGGVK